MESRIDDSDVDSGNRSSDYHLGIHKSDSNRSNPNNAVRYVVLPVPNLNMHCDKGILGSRSFGHRMHSCVADLVSVLQSV